MNDERDYLESMVTQLTKQRDIAREEWRDLVRDVKYYQRKLDALNAQESSQQTEGNSMYAKIRKLGYPVHEMRIKADDPHVATLLFRGPISNFATPTEFDDAMRRVGLYPAMWHDTGYCWTKVTDDRKRCPFRLEPEY